MKDSRIYTQNFNSMPSAVENLKTQWISGKLTRMVVTVFAGTIIPLISIQHTAWASWVASQQAQKEWTAFRKAYPFHMQIVGLTSPLNDKSRVLIVSEPPPDVSLNDFQRMASEVGGEVSVQKNPIGYDGWAKDVVVALPPLQEDRLSNWLAQLHRRLFGTTYKASVVQLPVQVPTPNQRSLDLSVSVGDLDAWLSKGSVQFTSILGSKPSSVPAILSSGRSGVFANTEAGLVIWSIPRNRDLADYRSEARQFFLDSDLIVGAMANDRQLVIVARKRVESLLRLPPLRVETALILAAEKSDELAQSYERNQLFAGKIPKGKDKGKDWAPIYLSDSLINTEIGSQLNITDQILKSWSLNGSVEYENFSYPKPLKWAPFPSPMADIQDNILFNWNTNGSGHTASNNSYVFFALNRTGALPITYKIKSAEVKKYEKISYKYFAELGNPDLARVVQYTTLYQILYNFNISTKKFSFKESLLSGKQSLAIDTFYLLSKLTLISPNEINGLFDDIQKNIKKEELNSKQLINFKTSLEETKNFLKFIHQGKSTWPNQAIPALTAIIADGSIINYIAVENPKNTEKIKVRKRIAKENINNKLKLANQEKKILSEDFIDGIAESFANLEYPIVEDSDLRNWTLSAYQQIQKPEVQQFLQLFSDISQVKDSYVIALKENDKSWIRTPSIVLSQDKTGSDLVGGHNLDSKITRFQPSTKVPVGTLSAQKDGTVLFNPNDIGKIHDLSHLLATEGDNPQIFNILTKVLNSPESKSRSPQQALNFSKEPRNIAPPSSNPPIGFNLREDNLTPQELQRIVLIDRAGQPYLLIDKSADGYTILHSGSNQAIQAHTIPALYDGITPFTNIPNANQSLKLYFNGFTRQEAEAFQQTAELRQLNAQKVILKKERSFEDNISLLETQYEWSTATLVEPRKLIALKESYYDYVQQLKYEVKPINPKQPTRLAKLQIFLKGLIPENFIKGLPKSIQKVFGNYNQKSSNFNRVIQDIRMELKQQYPTVEFDVRGEISDIFITEPLKIERYSQRLNNAH